MNICECGCNRECKRRFVIGHHKGNLKRDKVQTANFCQCGCGKICSNLFVQGHYAKLHSWNKGKTKETDSRLIYPQREIKLVLLCKCGCEQLCKPGNIIIHGHNRKNPFKKETSNSCGCGCGKPCRKKFCSGHQNRGKPSWRIGLTKETDPRIGPKISDEQKHSWTNICLCGCEEKCRRKFVPGHNGRGTHPNLGRKAWNAGLTSQTDSRIHAWNKGLTKETDERITTHGVSEKTRMLISLGNKGKTRNKGVKKSQKTRALMSLAQTGKIVSEQAKHNMSLGHIRSYVEHGEEIMEKRMRNQRWKKFLYTKIDGIVIIMRSSWEVLYAQFLDSQNIFWQYEPKQFKLSNGKRYWPDFFLPDLNEYHEVKGRLWPASQEKLDLFAKDYPDEKLVLLRGSDLKQLGIKL